MTQITPIQVGFPPQEASALIISSMPFLMGSLSSQIYYELISESSKVLANGNIDIPEDVHTRWLEDSVIEDYVLNFLQLTKEK